MALTAGEFDSLNLTAGEFDALSLTWDDFDNMTYDKIKQLLKTNLIEPASIPVTSEKVLDEVKRLRAEVFELTQNPKFSQLPESFTSKAIGTFFLSIIAEFGKSIVKEHSTTIFQKILEIILEIKKLF